MEIDEEGTEAAAATTVVKYKTGFAFRRRKRIPINFHATSQYIFFIYEPESSLVLFAGTIANPGGEQNHVHTSCTIV